ncbi:MAG TPA: hypothetical protein VGF04_01885 [Solirubrobacterales bacterium]
MGVVSSRLPGRLLTAMALAAMLATLAAADRASGAAGEPDQSFGNHGFSVIDEPSEPNEYLEDVVVLPDGKILGGGTTGGSKGFLLLRLNPDGSPDTGFGPGGIRIEPDLEAEPGLGSPGSPRGIGAMQLRGDGKLVVAGLGRGPMKFDAFEFGRYLPGGSLDPSFGSGGLTTVAVNEFSDALAMDEAPDGKLVATGGTGPVQKVPVVRLTENGIPDEDFNGVPAGIREVDVPGSSAETGLAVTVLGNGTILVGGFTEIGAFLAELDANGNPVMGFGTEGVAVFDLGTEASPSGEFFDLAVLPDGRIIAAGDGFGGSNDEEAVIARVTPSGQLDPSFGNGGLFRANPTPGGDEIESMEVLPDGRILAAGLRGETGIETEDADTWLFRLTPDGRLDPSFGSGGEVFASASPETDGAYGLAVQPDGRAVVAGEANVGPSQLMVGRFTADPVQPIAAPVKARRCMGRKASLVGTRKADRIRGTNRADVIATLGGNDRILSRGGNDVICAGAGKDSVKSGKGNDKVRGEAGADSLLGGPGRDLLLGEAGADRLFGGPGKKDLCNGGSGKRDKGSRSCERRKKLP